MEPTSYKQELQSRQLVPSIWNAIYNGIVYSFDVFLPIVDLHKEASWEPNPVNVCGILVQIYMDFHILAGWFFTTLAVAAVTGLVRSD